MKVAIVAPSPVPYTVGGAEKLWWGLLSELNSREGIEVELIKIPSPERTFNELMGSYRRFAELDLTHFDLIISTKYPAWMVKHPNHVCYLQHRLRGLYDTYHFCGQAEVVETFPATLQGLMDIIRSHHPSRNMLPAFWEELDFLSQSEHAELLAFPGPLTREIVHFLDSVALNTDEITGFGAISHNVAQRRDYFPAGAAVKVIHHPSDLELTPSPVGKSVFTLSRLDGAKRIELLVRAFMQTEGELDFRIAGTGPDAEKLKDLAADDKRIKFLGRINDAQVIDEYNDALFVPFIPYDEDYGLITIEAMQAGKPVVSVPDAGGVLEFVEHEQSGLIGELNPESLSQQMQRLIDAPDLAQRYGNNAVKRVGHIGWPTTVDQILSLAAPTEAVNEELGNVGGKIVVAVNFPVWPALSGGTSRIFHLYRHLAKAAHIELLTQCSKPADEGRYQLAPNLYERRICKSESQLDRERLLAAELNASVDDISAIQGYELSPTYITALAEACSKADLCIASHPYLFDAIRSAYRGPVWYDAHNVELDMKTDVLNQTPEASATPYLAQVRDIEGRCFREATEVLVCSEADFERMESLYGVRNNTPILAPNGVPLDQAYFADADERRRRKTRLGLQNQCLVLFMGSWHGPNIEAVEQIKEIAIGTPDVMYLIMGSVCSHPCCSQLPANVKKLGLVSDSAKRAWFATVDLALNPIISGSGTNLKMLDYAAAGIPVLSTPFGNRGLDFKQGRDIAIAPIEQFVIEIPKLLDDTTGLERMSKSALRHVERHFDWIKCAYGALKRLPWVEK